MAADAARGGPTLRLLEPYAANLVDDAYALRVMGGIHFRVLRGDEPALAAHYPSTGGDGDADAAWPGFRALLDDPPPELVDALRRPPQTNEVGRSASLVGGFLAVAAEFGLPLRVLELGAERRSQPAVRPVPLPAGSRRLRPHRLAGAVRRPVGRRAAALRRAAASSPSAAAATATRSTPPTADDRLRLLSYVWPDVTARFERTRAALELAAADPPPVDRADAADWIAEQLPAPSRGHTTVVFHSIVWQYLDADTADAPRTTIEAAGAAATADAPVAWLRLEPDDTWRAEGRPPPHTPSCDSASGRAARTVTSPMRRSTPAPLTHVQVREQVARRTSTRPLRRRLVALLVDARADQLEVERALVSRREHLADDPLHRDVAVAGDEPVRRRLACRSRSRSAARS